MGFFDSIFGQSSSRFLSGKELLEAVVTEANGGKEYVDKLPTAAATLEYLKKTSHHASATYGDTFSRIEDCLYIRESEISNTIQNRSLRPVMIAGLAFADNRVHRNETVDTAHGYKTISVHHYELCLYRNCPDCGEWRPAFNLFPSSPYTSGLASGLRSGNSSLGSELEREMGKIKAAQDNRRIILSLLKSERSGIRNYTEGDGLNDGRGKCPYIHK